MILVVFVAELDGGDLQHRSLGHAQTLGEAARGHVADDDLQRHDLHLFHQRLAVGQFLHKVGGHAHFFQLLHEEIGHLVFSQHLHQVVGKPVVHHALAADGAFLCSVAGGGVVLVIHDDKVRVVCGEYLFGFPLIQLFPFFHVVLLPLLCFIKIKRYLESIPYSAAASARMAASFSAMERAIFSRSSASSAAMRASWMASI